MELTQAYLKTILHYDPETGIFTRLSSNSNNKNNLIGKKVGGLTTSGYVVINIGYFQHRAHRLAFLYQTGAMPSSNLDHLNGEKDDNRWCNLREASNHQNMCNKKRYRGKKTGLCGAQWAEKAQVWRVFFSIDKKNTYLGAYDTIFEAAAVRISMQNNNGYTSRHGR
jgi:hypothetical protein